jgi:hypothetical protein
MAAVALLPLTESLQLKLGVWDGFARKESWGFSGNDIVLVAGELEYEYTLVDGAFPGVFSVGAGYVSQGKVLGNRFSAVHG